MIDSRYICFSHAVSTGNFKLMFIEAACLFDSDDRTHSIRSLKSLLNQSGLNNISDSFDRKLEPYKQLVSNIKVIRSKVIAYKEGDIYPENLFEKHGIKPNEIRDLLNTTAELLKELEAKLNTDSNCFSVGRTDRWEQATLNLLAALKAEKERNNKSVQT